MKSIALQPVNLSKAASFVCDLKISWRAFVVMLKSENRAARKAKGVSPADAFFNFIKLSFLKSSLVKYRHMVRFGDQVVMDSTFPPFPSRAFDKRVRNYINNLDLTELPTGIVSLSTTNACPYACAFCSTNARRDTVTDLDEELLKKTISQVEGLGVPSIILHGGEPLYRYDRFLRLVKHVSNDTCLWMFTTGYGATPERARELKENGLFGVWVSLDHFKPEVHNRLRGNPEAFDNACRAVEYFKQAGVYTCLSLVPPADFLEPENFKKYYDLARDLGAAEIRVMEVKPSGREACQGVIPHSPVLENLQKELFKDPAYREYPPLSGLSTWLEKDPALGCQCRFEYLFVTSTGEVQPCEAAEISFGNVQDEDFLEIYKRACRAFPQPATGCIPMVMFPEVREFQKVKDQLSSLEKSDRSTEIMAGFQARGIIPGCYRPLWSMYQHRLKAYRKRRAASAAYQA
ncbi:MAG TPA: radical SAM protein [Desulfomonilaceae bacterium]|nr:radical SAM protein [Desulfomonilaceae bacterium]